MQNQFSPKGLAAAESVLDAVCWLREHTQHAAGPVSPSASAPASFGGAPASTGPGYNPTDPPCVDRGLPTFLPSKAGIPGFIQCAPAWGACAGANDPDKKSYFKCTDMTKLNADLPPKFGCYYADGSGGLVRGNQIPASETCDCNANVPTPKFGRPAVGCLSYGQPYTDEANPPQPR